MKFEAFKKNGRYRWHISGTDGHPVAVRPGRVFLPPDPEADERSRRAVQAVLRQLVENAAPGTEV